MRIQNLNDRAKPFNYFDGPFQDRHHIDDGDILLSWSGTPGTSFGCFRWARGPALLNQHIFKVEVDSAAMDGDFFINAVNSQLDEMIRQAHGGVGLRHITKGKLTAMQLPVPALEEQRRIVARIKECMERVEEIEALRNDARTKALHLESSLYSAIKASTHAELRSVGQIIEHARNGRSIRQVSQDADGFVLTLSAVRGVVLDASARKPIELPESVAGGFPVHRDDVFVSRANTRELVGLASVAEATPSERMIYPDLLIKLRVKADTVLPRYLAYALRTSESRKQIKERSVGTSQSMVKISGQRLKEVRLPVPTLDVQEKLVEDLDAARMAVEHLIAEQRGREISHLRDAIVRKAFAGEL